MRQHSQSSGDGVVVLRFSRTIGMFTQPYVSP